MITTHHPTINSTILKHVNTTLKNIIQNKIIILINNKNHKNKNNLIITTKKIIPKTINFITKHTHNLIYLTLNETQITQLDLPMISIPKQNNPTLNTTFTINIKTTKNITTKINTTNQTHTIHVTTNPNTTPHNIITPNHIFPLKTHHNNILVHTNQTKRTIDLAQLTKLRTNTIIYKIIKNNNTITHIPNLKTFDNKHDLHILTITNLIQYQLQTKTLIKQIIEHNIKLDVTNST